VNKVVCVYVVSFVDKRYAHDDRQHDLAVPKVRSGWLRGGADLLANSYTIYLYRQRHLLPADRLPHHPHVHLLQTRLSSV